MADNAVTNGVEVNSLIESLPQGAKDLAVLIANDLYTGMLAGMVTNGVTFEAALYTVKAKFKEKTYSQTLTSSMNGLLTPGKVPAFQKQQNVSLITSFLDHLIDLTTGKKLKHHAPVQSVAPKTEAPLKNPMLAENVSFSPAKGMVAQLAEATKIGQKVKGTSPGSVYRVVALNDRIKIAVKMDSPTSLSVRVEWSDLASPDEMLKLKKYKWIGFKGDYASGHFQFDEKTNARRLFGALLFDLGIEFSQISLSPEFFNAN